MKKVLLVVLAVLAFGVVAVASPVAAVGRLTSSATAPGFADTPAFKPCTYGADGYVKDAGEFWLRPWWDGCSRADEKSTCARLKRGVSYVHITCIMNSEDITYYGSQVAVPCTPGNYYSMEALFLISGFSFVHNTSQTLLCSSVHGRT